MKVAIRNAIAAAAVAGLVAPAVFAQGPTAGDQDAKAKCEKLSGMERINCLDKLRAEGKAPPVTGTASGRPGSSVPAPSSPAPTPR
jgi:hypothetical protein